MLAAETPLFIHRSREPGRYPDDRRDAQPSGSAQLSAAMPAIYIGRNRRSSLMPGRIQDADCYPAVPPSSREPGRYPDDRREAQPSGSAQLSAVMPAIYIGRNCRSSLMPGRIQDAGCYPAVPPSSREPGR